SKKRTQAEYLVEWSLRGFGLAVGFARTDATNSYYPAGAPNWEERYEAIKQRMAGRPEGDEPATGDGRVTVYPARTTPSRFLCDTVDGVIDLKAPLEERPGGVIPPEYGKSLQEQVGRLKLPAGCKVLYRVRFPAPARQDLMGTLRPVTTALGFDAGFTLQYGN